MRRGGLALLAAVLALAARPVAVQPAPAGAPLRVGIVPAVGSMPLVVADHLSYFERDGLAVELPMFQDRAALEHALRAGRVDGALSDLMSALAARSSGLDVRVASGAEGVFVLLGAPGAGLRGLADWKARSRVKAALGASDIVAFAAEKMLRSGGVDPASIASAEPAETTQAPALIELLLSGRLDAACLAEPMASVAVRRGALRIADSTSLATTPGALVFRGRAVAERPRDIGRLLEAYDRAVVELNRNGNAYRPLAVARGGFPAEAQASFVMPRFRLSEPPTLGEVSEVETWMRARGLLKAPVAYRDLVVRLQ